MVYFTIKEQIHTMKIGLVCPYNMALGGAVQEITKESYDELKRRGHDVIIVSPTPSQGVPDLPNYHIRYIGKAYDLRAMGTTAQISFLADTKEIDRLFAEEKLDVLHVHEPWVPFINRQILKRALCPVVATFHAKLPDSRVAKLITTIGQVYTRPPLRYVSKCVAVSEPAAEHISAVLGKPVQIIPNAVNLAAFTLPKARKPIDHVKKTLLYVGRLEERKGVTYLLSAFKLLHDKHPDTQLLIGGDGPERVALEQQALAEGTGAVDFLGYLEDAHKKELLQQADLFCAPAIYGESFGVILVEALASGQVLVAGNNAGYASVLKELGEVSLIDPRGTKAHAELLEKMLYDEALRRQYQDWSQGYVKQYDYSVVTDQYEAIYKQLVAEAGHAREV